MNYPTTSIYPPSGRDATPVTPAAATVRTTPRVVLPPVKRVVGIGLPLTADGLRRKRVALHQVDRNQLLRVLSEAAATEDSHIAAESSWWRGSVEAEQATVARLREQRTAVAS